MQVLDGPCADPQEQAWLFRRGTDPRRGARRDRASRAGAEGVGAVQFTWAPDSRTRRCHFGVSLRTSAAAAAGLSLTTES